MYGAFGKKINQRPANTGIATYVKRPVPGHHVGQVREDKWNPGKEQVPDEACVATRVAVGDARTHERHAYDRGRGEQRKQTDLVLVRVQGRSQLAHDPSAQELQQTRIDDLWPLEVGDVPAMPNRHELGPRQEPAQIVAVVKGNGLVVFAPNEQDRFFELAQTGVCGFEAAEHVRPHGREDRPSEAPELHLGPIALTKKSNVCRVKEILCHGLQHVSVAGESKEGIAYPRMCCQPVEQP